MPGLSRNILNYTYRVLMYIVTSKGKTGHLYYFAIKYSHNIKHSKYLSSYKKSYFNFSVFTQMLTDPSFANEISTYRDTDLKEFDITFKDCLLVT